MKSISTNPRTAAITASLLALPFAILFPLYALGLEPSIEPLVSRLGMDEIRLDSFIVFGAFALLLAALGVSSAPILRNVRAGRSIAANPVNLVLALAILFTVILILGAIVVDQYPCWIGVPNCD